MFDMPDGLFAHRLTQLWPAHAARGILPVLLSIMSRDPGGTATRGGLCY